MLQTFFGCFNCYSDHDFVNYSWNIINYVKI